MILYKLRRVLQRNDKSFLVFLLFFSVVISLVETIGIGAIMPFIAVATDFSVIETNQYYNYFYNYFSFSSYKDFVIVFGTILIVFYLFRSVVNMLYTYFLNRFSFGRFHIIANRLFKGYINMPYKFFTKRNSSSLIHIIGNETIIMTHLVQNVLVILSEIFIVILLYGTMLYVNYKITLLLTVILAINGVILIKLVSKKIKKFGKQRSNAQKTFFEAMNKSFNNFKLIKLKPDNESELNEFSTFSNLYSRANIKSNALSQAPRLFLEAIGFGIIIFIIIFLVWKQEGDISKSLSIISMFVLALYRFMPSVNRIMSSYNQIMFASKSLDVIEEELLYDSEKEGDVVVGFNSKIELSNISFEYDDKPVFENLSLEIKKGEKIAFIGESGSGKSTLVDLIIGLHKPKNGTIKIDGKMLDNTTIRNWRSKIGYIPQNVYLFDGTVVENIVFGRVYNEDEVINSLKQANVYDFLMEKEGLQTIVGEGGVMLSGGQKQRIAIARALYGEPEILVLDEATSALDGETEEKIMEEIYKTSNNKTLIVIAHRLSTISKCERVYEMGKFQK